MLRAQKWSKLLNNNDMAFKLGKAKREIRTPDRTPIFRSKIDDSTLGEARMDGSIVIDPSIKPGSKLYKRVIKHEKCHLDQIESGRASYGDNYVEWEGKLYIRNNGYVYGPAGKLPEGHPDHPWEAEAIQAEEE